MVFLFAAEREVVESSRFPEDKFRTAMMRSKWLQSDAYSNEPFHGPGRSDQLWLGMLDPFDTVHIEVINKGTPAKWYYSTRSWNGTLVASPVPPAAIISDTTKGGSQTGRLELDASQLMATWIPGRRPFGTPKRHEGHCYCLMLPGTYRPATYKTIKSRSYLDSIGGETYTPVFDSSADANQDGYLSPSERVNADADKTARFRYESRLGNTVQNWYVDLRNIHARRHIFERDIKAAKDWDGILYDIAEPQLPTPRFHGSQNREYYQALQGSLYRSVAQKLADDGKFVCINISGWKPSYNPWLVQWLPIVYLDRTWRSTGDTARFQMYLDGHRDRWASLQGQPLLSIYDWLGGDGNCLSERVKYAGYCAYLIHGLEPHRWQYLAGGFNADKKKNGKSGRSHWLARHWAGKSFQDSVKAHDIGKPLADYAVEVEQNGGRIYRREFERATVYYAPADAPRQAIQLGDRKVVDYDGSLKTPGTVTLMPNSGLVVLKTSDR